MNFDEEYLKRIAFHRYKNMKAYGEQWERSRLKRYGWNFKETSQIIKYEREFIKENETQ